MPRQSHLHIGDMRDRITPIVETKVVKGGGAVEITESAGTTIRCRVKPMKGREYFQARQIFAGTPVGVTAWYKDASSFTSDSRFTWHHRSGDKVIHAQTALAVDADGMLCTFMGMVKE